MIGNNSKPYDFDEHISGSKIMSDKMKDAVKLVPGQAAIKEIGRLAGFLVSNSLKRIGENCIDTAIRELSGKMKAAEERPVFTQAMTDAKELPPAGSDIMIRWIGDVNPSYTLAKVLFSEKAHHGIVGIVAIGDGDKVCFDTSGLGRDKCAQIKPIDNKTKKEKAIDELHLHLTRGGAIHDDLHDANSYLFMGVKNKTTDEKPVFTQAMADGGESPPVGSNVLVNVAHKGECKAVVIGSHQRWVWLDVCGIGLCTYDLSAVSCIDNRTDKEKAIDEMYKDVFNDEFINDDIMECDEYLFCVKSIEKGYRK